MTNDNIFTLTVSIVTFNNADTIEVALNSIFRSPLTPENCKVIVVDNGSTDNTVEIVSSKFPQVRLIRSENVGFGAGHNKAIREIMDRSRFHLVMNPDIYFSTDETNGDVLSTLIGYMDNNPEVGLVMPKILYPGEDQRTQHLCKLLPTPLDLIGRRFIPGFIKSLPPLKKRFRRYEMRDRDYDRMMVVPHLSGCFMMLRTGVFREVGLFDERFFMYLEDVDFSRRIHEQYKTVYNPSVFIYHNYHKGSYHRLRHLGYHIRSAIKYFNKWGWFFDKERRQINASNTHTTGRSRFE